MPSLLGTRPGVHYKSLKTVNQSLKHKVNRWVLSLRLNECKLSVSRTAAGRLFHTTGPATEMALLPNFVRGTVQSLLDAERRRVRAGSLLHTCTESPRQSGQQRVWTVNITSASLNWILYTTGGSQCSSTACHQQSLLLTVQIAELPRHPF